MFHPRALTILTAVAVAAGALLAAAPQFQAQGFGLKITDYEASIEHTYEGARTQHDYSVGMAGFVTAPRDLDVVCINSSLGVTSIRNRRGDNLIKDADTVSREFTAFHSDTAAVEVPESELTAHPYTIGEFKTRAQVLVARQRQSVEYAGDVMEAPREAPGGMTLRVRSMEIADKGLAEVEVAFKRLRGLGHPFLESIYALNEAGEVIGGGRWTDGNPLGEDGRLQTEFQIKPGERWDRVRCVICTEYDVRDVTFTVTDVFQQ